MFSTQADLSDWSQGEAMYINFHWLFSNDVAQKEIILNGLISHHLIMITCISYEIILTISLAKSTILIHFKPVQSVLQIPPDTVTQIPQV